MQAGPFTSSELRAAAAEMQAETQADGEVSTAVQPSHHAQGNKLYLATHQPAFERALLLAVGPHVETRPRTAGLGTLCLLARLPGPKIIMAAGLFALPGGLWSWLRMPYTYDLRSSYTR